MTSSRRAALIVASVAGAVPVARAVARRASLMKLKGVVAVLRGYPVICNCRFMNSTLTIQGQHGMHIVNNVFESGMVTVRGGPHDV